MHISKDLPSFPLPQIMYATSPYSDPVVSADTDPQPIIDEEEGLIWVVGPVLAVVFHHMHRHRHPPLQEVRT